MENKQVTKPAERVLIVAMVEPGKPDPLTVLHRIQTAIEATEGVVSVEIQQVGNTPISARTFGSELEKLINAYSLENGSNTPDFVLASFVKSCLDTWNLHTKERDRWYGNRSLLGPGNDMPSVDTSEISMLPISPAPAKPSATPKIGPVPLKPLGLQFGLQGAVNQVYLFHEKFGVPWYTDDPQWPGPRRVALRERLMRDEHQELVEAWEALNEYLLGAGCDDNVVCAGDGPDEFAAGFRKRLAAIAREMVDEIYTIIGTAGEFGIDLAAVWDVVHRSNMAKVVGNKDAQGKVLKPEGWQGPDVESAIFGKP